MYVVGGKFVLAWVPDSHEYRIIIKGGTPPFRAINQWRSVYISQVRGLFIPRHRGGAPMLMAPRHVIVVRSVCHFSTTKIRISARTLRE